MEFKLLVKNTSYLVGTKFVKFFAGIIRSKLNAIFIGTAGVGIVSQFLMLINSSSSFTTLGMNEAVVKQIAGNSDSDDSKNIIASSIKTYLITVSLFLIISSSILILFRNSIAEYIFGSNEYLNFFYLALITFPLLIINGVFFSILKGFKAIKHIASARIGIIISNLILFIPLVVLYKLKGAIIYLPISFLITLVWNFYFSYKYYLKPNNLSFKSILNASTKSSFQREMLTFSGYGLIVSVMAILSAFIGRSIVVTNLGIDKIGIYTPIVMWAGLFTGFLLPSFNTYLFPRFTEVKSNIEASGIINDALRLATLSLLPLLLLAIPFRFILIKIFYSSEFLEAAEYLPFHFIGVVFNVWFVIFGQSMTPRGYIKQHSIFKLTFYIISLSLAFLLVPKMGLYGWMLKFVISYFFLFIVNYIFLKTRTNFKISNMNIVLMMYILISGLILIGIEQLFGSNLYGMIIGPTLLFLSYFLLSYKEKEFIKSKVLFITKRFR